MVDIDGYTTVIPIYNKFDNLSSPHSHEQCLRHPCFEIPILSLLIVTIIFSMIENILLWVAFCVKRRLRTIPNTYIISLSISDFVVIVTLAWMETYYIWNYPKWELGETGTNIENAFWCFSLICPFLHSLLISIDRYKAVNSPIVYTETKSWIVELGKIIALWVYCISVVSLMAFNFSPASEVKYEWNILPEWYYPFLALHTIIPLLLSSVLYWKMIVIVRTRKNDVDKFNNDATSTEFKFARTVGMIILLMYFVWIPVIVMEAIYALLAHTCTIEQIGVVSVWLCCTSGVINPTVFLWKNEEFRKTMKRILCCGGKRKPVQVRMKNHESNSIRITTDF